MRASWLTGPRAFCNARRSFLRTRLTGGSRNRACAHGARCGRLPKPSFSPTKCRPTASVSLSTWYFRDYDRRIVLGLRSSTEATQLRIDLLAQLSRAEHPMSPHESLESLSLEHLPFHALRLDHSVGVKNQDVSRQEIDEALVVPCA